MKPWLTISLVWLGFAGLNILLGLWNVAIVRRRKKAGNTDQIEHGPWAAAYCVVVGAACFFLHLNWWLSLSLVLLHASIFPVAYNADSGLNWFFLSKKSKAWFDQQQVKLGLSDSKDVNIAAFISSLAILIILIKLS